MIICCLDEMKKHLRGVSKPTVSVEQNFVVTDPRKRSHGVAGDCAILAISIVNGWSYESTGRLLNPFLVKNRTGGVGITGGDLIKVLSRFGFHPVRFQFPLTLADLWDSGFFEVQKRLRRVGVVSTKSLEWAHLIAFRGGLFYGDYLPERDNVTCVLLKNQRGDNV